MTFTLNPDDPILNPSLWIGSFELREPVTTLTDFLTAMVSLSVVIYFLRYKGERNKNFNLYLIYFICFAISMTSAAWLGHGLQAYISPKFKMIGWTLSAIGFTSLLFASVNQIENKLGEKGVKLFKLFIIMKLLIFFGLIINPSTSSFKLVQLNSTLDVICLALPLHILNYKWNKSRGSLRVIGTFIYAIIPGLVYNNQLSIDKWFNYHDISHVLMAFFIFLMSFGAFELSTNKSASTNV